MQVLNKIISLDRKRCALLVALGELMPMVPGAYKEVYRKCGKPTCWCASEPNGHPYKRITWTENNVSKTKAIKDEQLVEVLQAIGNYKKFQNIQELVVELDVRIQEAIKLLTVDLVTQTRKKKTWGMLKKRQTTKGNVQTDKC